MTLPFRIVCLGCGANVDQDDWPAHRRTCLGLAEQLSLSAELEPAVFEAELTQDVEDGYCRAWQTDPATGEGRYIARARPGRGAGSGLNDHLRSDRG